MSCGVIWFEPNRMAPTAIMTMKESANCRRHSSLMSTIGSSWVSSQGMKKTNAQRAIIPQTMM